MDLCRFRRFYLPVRRFERAVALVVLFQAFFAAFTVFLRASAILLSSNLERAVSNVSDGAGWGAFFAESALSFLSDFCRLFFAGGLELFIVWLIVHFVARFFINGEVGARTFFGTFALAFAAMFLSPTFVCALGGRFLLPPAMAFLFCAGIAMSHFVFVFGEKCSGFCRGNLRDFALKNWRYFAAYLAALFVLFLPAKLAMYS